MTFFVTVINTVTKRLVDVLCLSHHITSFSLRFVLLFLQVPWCLWIKAVPFLTTEDLPLESYSGSKAAEHLAHFLCKPTPSKCSYNRCLDWALRFGAWKEFKLIKDTYHWKHLYFNPPGLYHVFITSSWQPCANICYLLPVTWTTAGMVQERPTGSRLRAEWRATERNHWESKCNSHMSTSLDRRSHFASLKTVEKPPELSCLFIVRHSVNHRQHNYDLLSTSRLKVL